MSNIVLYRNEDIVGNKLGIKTNKIAKISEFLTNQEIYKLETYLSNPNHKWGETSFHNSHGISLSINESTLVEVDLPNDFFLTLTNKLKAAVEDVFGHRILESKCHAQKWEVGGFAEPHSDNSDHEGNISEYGDMKYVSILYINSDYSGGEVYFPEHSIEIKPAQNDLLIFPGGFENIHGVKEITQGIRYTIMAFWDF